MISRDVLVDTSVWIKYFKQGNSIEAIHLDHLIVEDSLVVCDPIKAEILSGVKSIEDYKKVLNWLEGFNNLSLPLDIWQRASHARFNLARKGIQQSLIDLIIALTAYEYGVPVWSLDNDFKSITEVVSIKIYHPKI